MCHSQLLLRTLPALLRAMLRHTPGWHPADCFADGCTASFPTGSRLTLHQINTAPDQHAPTPHPNLSLRLTPHQINIALPPLCVCRSWPSCVRSWSAPPQQWTPPAWMLPLSLCQTAWAAPAWPTTACPVAAAAGGEAVDGEVVVKPLAQSPPLYCLLASLSA